MMLISLLLMLVQAATPPDRVAQWQQDIQFMAEEMMAGRGQADFAKLYPKASFESSMAALRADIPKLSDTEVVFQIMRIIAGANVAHNAVQFPNAFGFFRRLPLTLYWYADGLGVASAAPEYGDAIGARVSKIGDRTPEQLFAELSPFISHEDNIWLREQAPRYMVTLAGLQHLGLLGADGRVALTVSKSDGSTMNLAVAVGDPRQRQETIAEHFHLPAPLFEVNDAASVQMALNNQQRKPYSYRYLADSRTLYIQYNRCQNDPSLPFAEFVSQAIAEGDSRGMQRLVLDLRGNGGGDESVIAPLGIVIASRPQLRGRVFVLIGPATFSSALSNALSFSRVLHARLVGSTPGERFNGYGEVKLLTMPNSKLRVQYTTKYMHQVEDSDPQMLQPDIVAPFTLTDAVKGRDAALAAAIAAPAP